MFWDTLEDSEQDAELEFSIFSLVGWKAEGHGYAPLYWDTDHADMTMMHEAVTDDFALHLVRGPGQADPTSADFWAADKDWPRVSEDGWVTPLGGRSAVELGTEDQDRAEPIS